MQTSEQAAKKDLLLQEFIHDVSNLFLKIQRNTEKLKMQEKFANETDLNLLNQNVEKCINLISEFKRHLRDLDQS